MNTKQVCIPWSTVRYDNAHTIALIRNANPQANWSTICEIHNTVVPLSRKRTVDVIANKWKSMKIKGFNISAPAAGVNVHLRNIGRQLIRITITFNKVSTYNV